MEGKFDCFTTLFPQSVVEMFQKESLRLRKFHKRVENFFTERRISIARCENEKKMSPSPELCASLKPEVRDFVEGTFDCVTILFPQSVMEMFQKKSLILRKYQESRKLSYRTKNLNCAL